ncbi:MAG: TlyA family RNA methyltransferase [Clostridia bacterium]|nr:TlyA family RNA methyltransferase [Clostridia bacterium]MBQ5793221.1 TlyA family RNA methyltransferase [Clostridia bacterium]
MRADVYLVENGYVKSRTAARKYIEAGHALLDGKVIAKPSQEIDGEAHDVQILERERYVSRGGLKLEGALQAFSIDVRGMRAADIGASTGGFTDCLLQAGAAHVYAIDSGRDQLDPDLILDERVSCMEGVNARYLTPEQIGGCVDIVVMDVSFISQTLILPCVASLLRDGGIYVGLIKPQFEAGRAALDKHGIVKGVKYRREAVERVLEAAAEVGLGLCGLITSPIEGGDGNVEYLAYYIKGKQSDTGHGAVQALFASERR